MQIQMVVFSEPKAGHAPGEWEDGACGGVSSEAGPGQVAARARFVVADGATEAYDSLRWVDQLVTSFAPTAHAAATAPELEPAAMCAWFTRMQDQWVQESPDVFDSIIEERKYTEVGAFATLLGCEMSGLDGPEPSWRAVALGDTILFHVRDGRLLAAFPSLGPDDFGSRPEGVSTLRSRLNRMSDRLLIGGGALAPGDFLFAATDAMAHWIIRAAAREETKVWAVLTTLAHPSVFARLVDDQRKAKNSDERMKNDDVTLLRLRLLAEQPSFLVTSL
jgi:hypothetical protein